METRSQKKNSEDANKETSKKDTSPPGSPAVKKGQLVTEREFRERMSDRTHSLVTNPECAIDFPSHHNQK
jgi:hypothetical protein